MLLKSLFSPAKMNPKQTLRKVLYGYLHYEVV